MSLHRRSGARSNDLTFYNILHDIAREESVLLVVDVDMRLGHPYFAHSLAFAKKGSSVYFPIV